MANITATNVYMFYPNLIGFGRVILGLMSLLFMMDSPYTAMFLYWLSAFLDAFDGLAARHFNQTSSFGAVLDMVSDRCTTLALLVTLGALYPKYLLYFQLVIILDISSHWIHMYSALSGSHSSHKDSSKNPLLKLYYSKVILFSLCSANELFWMALYLGYFSTGPILSIFGFSFGVWTWMAYLMFAPCALKHLISLVQLFDACSAIASKDAIEYNSRVS
eukprot:m.66807 g.66807  ORF g.66807 m.66807 type:complete len:219 (-) comp13782_c0_seq3:176-832(-)